MSTRKKLIVLVLVTSLAGSSSLFINSLMMRPVNRIETEQKVLEELSFRLIDYIGQVNKLDSEIFTLQKEKMFASRKALDESFQAVGKLEFLPSVNASIYSSIDTILLFSNSLVLAQRSLDERIESIEDFARNNLDNKKYSIIELAWGVSTGKIVSDEISDRVFFLEASISTLNNKIDLMLTNLDAQYSSISEEIRSYQKRARRLISLVLLLVIAVPLVFVLMIANMLAGRIRKIEIGISRMRNGDLADRIPVASRDEMGRLSRNVNEFTEELSLSMLRIKEASRINMTVKESLLSSVEQVSSTTEQLNHTARSISESMTELSETVTVTDAAVGTVENKLNILEMTINDQVSMIEETSAAMTQMIASVTNVSDITVKKKTALANLVEYSNKGGLKLNETNDVISKVHDSIEEIRSTAGLIANIAAQTNLLAMNAAIEAAHAGDAGRGFAVVADEIRNLAEATTKNSKRIDGVMKTVVGNIEDAAESGKSTGSVFTHIDKEVSEASASFDEIASSMEELKTGGSQILDAMTRLSEISVQVQEGDVSMMNAAVDNRKAVEKVERISSHTTQSVKEISQALDSLVDEMSKIAALTHKAESISETLENEVVHFKVDESLKADAVD